MDLPVLYSCPLCCHNTFSSKQSLAEHLVQISLNIVCTICNQSFSSLELLTEHLKVENCDFQSNDESEILGNDLPNIVKVEHDMNSDSTQDNGNKGSGAVPLSHKAVYRKQKKSTENNAVNKLKLTTIEDDTGSKMYVELLSKQLTKPCLQTQEMKLVREDGQSRYVILADDGSLMSQDVTIVTRQNNDGTISLTALKETESSENEDGKMPDPAVPEDEAGDKDEELYTCNTCGVSFSSVLEHIQNYHTDEDVVVHDTGSADSLEFESNENNKTVVDKQSSRRMITETGNIIEAPPPLSVTTNQLNQANQIDKNSVYHKVVMKEMQTTGGNKVKLYNCLTCNIYVTTLDEFKQQPCKILKYQCPQCPAAYENSKSLCAHMKAHKLRNTECAPVLPLKFECEICNTQFLTSKSLKLHKKMHEPIKSRPIDPPLETSEGTPASTDKYLCGICEKLIPIDYRLIHQNSHNTNNNKMNCDVCNKKFHSKEYLEMHMSVHKIDKAPIEKSDKLLPYKCLYCERKFARPHEKVKHERIHTGEKPHECEICGKSFRVSYCLTLHMRTHTGARPYACPHCNKRFKAHSVYNHHLLTHSEVRAYKCPFCPKAFKTSVQLAGHKNSHTKPFSCQQCNRPFASLYAVRVHMEIHTRQNSLKFVCSLCGASYARAFALKDHVKQVHKQDIDTAENISLLETKDWLIQGNTDVDSEVIPLNKDLPQDMNELGIHTELIIP